MLAWGALAAFLLLTELGAFLRLSKWAMDISPFTHVPKLPGGTFTATPLLWLLCCRRGADRGRPGRLPPP